MISSMVAMGALCALETMIVVFAPALLAACCKLLAVSCAPLKVALKSLLAPAIESSCVMVLMFTAWAVLTLILVLLPAAVNACCKLSTVHRCNRR